METILDIEKLYSYKNDKKERFDCFLLTSAFFLAIVFNFINEILVRIGLSTLSTVFYPIEVCMALLIYGNVLFIHSNSKIALRVFIGFILFLVADIIFHPNNVNNIFNVGSTLKSFFLSNIATLVFYCFPLILFVFRIEGEQNKKIIEKYCYNYCLIICFLFIITMIFCFTSSMTFNYMTIAYNATPAIIVLNGKKGKISKITLLVSAFMIFIGGCRGALLQLAISFILLFLLRKGNPIKKVIIVIIIVMITVVLILYFDSIITSLYSFFKNIGYNSRILQRMIQNDSNNIGILYIDDRAEVYDLVKSHLGIIGHGFFSDPAGVLYPHNIVLELIQDFGYIIGILLFVFLTLFIFKSLKIIRNNTDDFAIIIWILLFTEIFVKLMLSSSYLIDRPLFFAMGITLLLIRKHKGNGKCVNIGQKD